MKRIFILLLALMLCLPCVMAEEIGELAPPTVEQPSDPNEIGELGGNSTPNAATTVNENIAEVVPPANNNELIEDAAPAANNEESIVDATPVANNEGFIEDATPAAPVVPVASGETAVLQNVVLAVPAGWSVLSRTDDTASGGSISLNMMANDGSNQLLQAQSQSIGTQESIKGILDVLGAESFLSQTLVGTMQNFGIIVENYEFVMLGGNIPCVKATEIITMDGESGFISMVEEVGECAMSMVVALDDTHMVVMVLIQEGADVETCAATLNVMLSPMAQ